MATSPITVQPNAYQQIADEDSDFLLQVLDQHGLLYVIHQNSQPTATAVGHPVCGSLIRVVKGKVWVRSALNHPVSAIVSTDE